MWQHGSCLVDGWSPGGAQSDLTLILAEYICHCYHSRLWYFIFFFSPHSQVAIPISSEIWLRSNNLETKRGRALPGTVRLWTRILIIPFRCWQKGKGRSGRLTGSWDLLAVKPGPHSSAQATAPLAWCLLSFLHGQCIHAFLQTFCRFPGLGMLGELSR